MPFFSVDPDLCRRDGICASVCPAHVIKGPKGTLPVMRPDRDNMCIACGHCMAFCPHGAARVDVLPLEDMQPVDRKRLPDVEAVEMLCKTRRSIRRFKPEPIPKEVLERILDVTRHAPSAKNRRPVRWVTVYEQETLRAVGNSVSEWLEMRLTDPETAKFMPEAKGLVRAWRNGLDPLFRGAPHMVMAVTPTSWKWGVQDASVALTYLEIAAFPHNVGSCWAGYVSSAAQHHKPLQEMLGIGPDEQVQGGQLLGYVALRPTASAPRTPLSIDWL